MFETWANLSDVNYKPGVSGSPTDAIASAIAAAESVWASIGQTLTVTSLMDGTHMVGSCHYSGNAVDLRTRDLTGSQQQQVYTALQQQLPGYQVIWEADHIHVQYRPAGGCSAASGSAPVQSDPGTIDTSGDPGSIDTTGQSSGTLDLSGVTDFFANASPLVLLLGLGVALYLFRR